MGRQRTEVNKRLCLPIRTTIWMNINKLKEPFPMPSSLKHGNQRHCTSDYYFGVAGRAQFFLAGAFETRKRGIFYRKWPPSTSHCSAPRQRQKQPCKILWCSVCVCTHTLYSASNVDSLAFGGINEKYSRHVADTYAT